MLSPAELEKNYRPVHGDPNNLHENNLVVLMHNHVGDGDGTSPASGIILEAIGGGVDKLYVTNHNTDGYDLASKIRDRLERGREEGHHLEIGRAVEITAVSGEHVLVYEFSQLPAPGQSIERLIEESEQQGAFVSLAHPELGAKLGNYSVTEQRIKDLLDDEDLPRFALEVHTGAGAQIEEWGWLPAPGFIRRQIPEPGSNALAKIIFERHDKNLLGATGGPDAHNRRHTLDVIFTHRKGMNTKEAIEQRKGVIWEKRRLPRPTVTNLIGGHVRGILLERKRQRSYAA